MWMLRQKARTWLSRISCNRPERPCWHKRTCRVNRCWGFWHNSNLTQSNLKGRTWRQIVSKAPEEKQNREWPSKRSEQANVRSKSWDKRRRKHRKEINQWKSLVYSNTEARNAAEIGVNILMKACISKQESGLRSSCAQACSSIPIAFLLVHSWSEAEKQNQFLGLNPKTWGRTR